MSYCTSSSLHYVADNIRLQDWRESEQILKVQKKNKEIMQNEGKKGNEDDDTKVAAKKKG